MAQQTPSEGTEQSSQGSRSNPVPRGETVRVGDWEVRVAAFDGDAWERLREHNRRPRPPAEGLRDVMVTLEATYVGDSSSDPGRDFAWSVVGSGGNTFDGLGEGRMLMAGPDAFKRKGETFPGGSISGNAYFSVAEDQIDGATFWVKTSRAERVFFALG